MRLTACECHADAVLLLALETGTVSLDVGIADGSFGCHGLGTVEVNDVAIGLQLAQPPFVEQ